MPACSHFMIMMPGRNGRREPLQVRRERSQFRRWSSRYPFTPVTRGSRKTSSTPTQRAPVPSSSLSRQASFDLSPAVGGGHPLANVPSVASLAAQGNGSGAPAFDDNEDGFGESDEVIMALEMKNDGAVGCAYFVAATMTLYLQEDTPAIGLQLAESALLQARPTTVIIPSRAPEAFVEYLERQSQRHRTNLGDDDEGSDFALHTTASSDFASDYGKESLAPLNALQLYQPRSALISTSLRSSERNEILHLGSLVNLDNHITLGCVSALLRDLGRRQTKAGYREADLFRVKTVRMITYSQCMFITADTLFALQIFRPGSTRADGKQGCSGGGKGSKDDIRSVFDLFRPLALTLQGRRKLREVFVRPSIDLKAINACHESISILLEPQNQDTIGSIRTALKDVRSIRPLLAHLRRGVLLPKSHASVKQSAWEKVYGFCSRVVQIFHLGHQKSLANCTAVTEPLGKVHLKGVSGIKESITQKIDFLQSRLVGRTVVASGADPELDRLKTTYENLRIRLDNICGSYKAKFLPRAQGHVKGCISHPRMGYLVIATADTGTEVGHSESSQSEERATDFDTWEEVMREGSLVYYKTPEMEALDSTFGDIAGQITELEVEVFYRLASEVLGHEDILLTASDALGEVDSILALATGAERFHLSRPQMTSENILDIRSGRHILQELERDYFVPNDCWLAGSPGENATARDAAGCRLQSRMREPACAVILTGPNNAGKSVYLKQVALTVYLAHIGSFVPAERAIVGLTDKILTRIATRESVSRNESAFGIDLRQAALSINLATRNSLVLADEFGKGTSNADGAALFDALLSHFLCPGIDDTPKVLAATQFHEIFECSNFEQHSRHSLAHMRVAINPDASQPEDRIEYLYKLESGRSTESFGCHCAAIDGVESAVIARAARITKSFAQGTSLERICLDLSAVAAEELREDESRAREFLMAMEDSSELHLQWQNPRHFLEHILPHKRSSASNGVPAVKEFVS